MLFNFNHILSVFIYFKYFNFKQKIYISRMKAFRYSCKFWVKQHMEKYFFIIKGLKRFSSKDRDLDNLIDQQNRLLNANSHHNNSKEHLPSNDEHHSSEEEENSNLRFSSISSEYMDPKLEISINELKLKCHGCGTHLQTNNDHSVGYIPHKKLKEHFEKKNIDNKAQNNDDIEVIYEGEEMYFFINKENP